MNNTPNMSIINKKSKILVIDDNATDREITIIMLENNNCDVIELSSGKKIIETIAREKPDLILLDIMMPEIDGNQILQQIRKTHTQIELPVIMVTSKIDDSDIIESLKIGANDYITKPLQFEIAFRRIQTHVTIAAQSKKMIKAKELEAIHAMIATYNHEINNPLSIAIGNLSSIKTEYPENLKIIKLETALWRIAEIIKNTHQVLLKDSIEYEKYSENIKILNLNASIIE